MKELNCEQIEVLLSYFIDKKLSSKIMKDIEYHLNTCSVCREKYMNLQRIKRNYEEITEKIYSDDTSENLESEFFEKEYKVFQENISAYIDNELDDRENIRIKKFAIINPEARQNLENLISFRILLQESFEKTKSKLKTDLSEQTMYSIKENNSERLANFSSKNFSTEVLIFFYVSLALSVFVFFNT